MRRSALTALLVLVAGALLCRGEVVCLENARYKLGVDLNRGGMLSSFVDKRGDASLNLVYGNGVQPTFRGNGYTAVVNARAATAHNLFAGGRSLAIADESTVVNANDGQPMKASVWLQYDLHEDYVTVAVSFLDSTGQINGANDHELPALYAVPSLSTFTCCQAADGWVGAELSSWAKPGFWGGNSEAYKTIASDERWCAWTNPTTGRGLGVYSPSAGTILMGRMTDGSCSYAAPLAHSAVKSGVTVGYVYYLAAGTVAEMRDVFAAVYFQLGEGGGLGKSGIRIDGTSGKLGVSAFEHQAGRMSFTGRFVSLNGVQDSEDFALVCRSNLVERESEFLLPVEMSVAEPGENNLAEVAMALDDPPPSLFVMGVSERPSPYREQMVAKGFPGTYADLMAALHERHPKWEFEPLFVSDMTWDAVLDKEMVPSRNLVAHSTWAPSPWNTLGLANYTPYYAENAQSYDSGSFYQASRAAVAYFMDPRNFLNDTEIFMFETLAYNEASQTQAAIEKALSGSFMANACYDGGTEKFSALILSVGRELDVSPVFLSGRLKSEQGNGTVQAQGKIGDSLWELYADADGKVGGSNVWGTKYTKDNQATADVIAKGKDYYNGYYNLFNMGASGTGLFEIRYNAWKEAAEAPAKYHGPWTSQEKALYGGSVKVKERYIDTHRHTSYLQKFSVLAEAGSSRWSQYMQNIAAPLTESRSTKEAYVASRAYEDAHVFLVPVYLNMPSAPCPDPANGNSVYSPTK